MTDTTHWRVQAVTDAERLEAQPPALAPAEAQPGCNFVVWEPTELPPACELSTGTLRRQAPPGRVEGVTAGRSPWSDVNPAAYRYEIAGPGRRLRVKQFLYDWTFPALDAPCLWESQTRAVPLGDQHILWFGCDYMGHPAASTRRARTNIELSVLDGEFSDDEITALYQSMRPAVPDVVDEIAGTPFALLSYWARYPEATMLHVPIGLWKFRRKGRVYTGRWTAEPDGIAGILDEYRLPSELQGLPADSAARFTDADGKTEAEIVYAGGPRRGYELRLIAQRCGAGHLTFPSQPEDHPHQEGLADVGSVPGDLAWTDERFGPWDIAWRDERHDIEAKLVSSTAVPLDLEWFLRAAAEVAKAYDSAG